MDDMASGRGYKLNLNRFYGVIEVGEEDIKRFYRKRVVFTHTALESDYLGRGAVQRLVVQRGSTSTETGSTARSIVSGEEAALRKACGNAYALAALFHEDDLNLSKQKMVILLGRHTRKWQGRANKALLSVDATEGWMRKQIKGAFMQTMGDVLNELRCEGTLSSVGFTLPRAHKPLVMHDGDKLTQN